MFSNNLTMMTDLYELTMMQGYFFEGNEDKVVFNVFYRKNPSGSAYAITCGLDQVIDYIKNLSFSYEDIDYLRGLGIFKEDFLSYLANDRAVNPDSPAPDYGISPTARARKLSAIKSVRIELSGNIYRLLGFFQNGNIVILTNGFQKKTQKTPANEIEICKERMKELLSRGTKK